MLEIRSAIARSFWVAWRVSEQYPSFTADPTKGRQLLGQKYLELP